MDDHSSQCLVDRERRNVCSRLGLAQARLEHTG
jgi:hypothetical protein